MRLVKRFVFCLLVLIIGFAVLNIPANTKQSINGIQTVKKIPLYVKVCGFLYRDYMYRDLSRHITDGIEGDKDKVMAIYAWTVENIKRKPEDFKVIDDHIWDIIARRYGLRDQMADVFVTLASYAGYEAFWDNPVTESNFIASFVRINDTWYMFDIYNKRSFLELEDRELLASYNPDYSEYLNKIDKDSFFKSRIRRADQQKILPRIFYELKKVFIRGKRCPK